MKLKHTLAALIGVGVAVAGLGLLGFRFNLTASLPLGIYRVTAEQPVGGSIVRVCLPRAAADFASERGYLGPGSCPSRVRPLGKLVLAVEGDLLTLERAEVRLNGTAVPSSETITRDSRGRALPHYPWGEHRIGPEELWVFSPYNRNAYDSRYFGPVHTSQVVSVLQPLWTWRRGSGSRARIRLFCDEGRRGRQQLHATSNTADQQPHPLSHEPTAREPGRGIIDDRHERDVSPGSGRTE